MPLGKARGSKSCLSPLQGSGRIYIPVMDKREQIGLLVRNETWIEISFVIIFSISTRSAREIDLSDLAAKEFNPPSPQGM